MTTRKLTDTEIAARIVPTALRWPTEAKTIAWDRMRECVDALRGLAVAVNNNCLQAELDQDLSSDGIKRRRNQVGRQALAELETFKAFQTAEKSALENLKFLEEKMVDLPKSPTSFADVMMAQEIRQDLRNQKSPIDAAVKSISDPRILGAILNAPSRLSGLSEAEFNLIHERARTTFHPEQVQMQASLIKARDELREGISATRRLLHERCGIEPDSLFVGNLTHPIASEPEPKPAPQPQPTAPVS